MELPAELPTIQALMDHSVNQTFPSDDPESSPSDHPVGEMTTLMFNFFVAILDDEACHVVLSG